MFSTRLTLPARRALTAASVAFLLATPRILVGQSTEARPIANTYAGTWQGTLDVGIQKLRLGLTLARDASGAVSGYLTSIDQGNGKIPAILSTNGDSLVADVAPLQIHYASVLTAGGDSLRGVFKQGPNTFPLAMGRVAALAVGGPPPARPQTPKPPYPYRAEDVSVPSASGVTLSCTLLTVAGNQPSPAVTFVTGSGPQDRNEMLLGHQPFLVIADYLARRGIASLRCDDRGIARSTGNFATATSADFADDAEAQVRWLRARKEIAANHVGIIGHSEGGLVGPIVAARSRDVAFVVMMAGPGIPGDSILLLQQQLIAVAGGQSPELAARGAANNARMFAAIRDARDSADADARAHAALHAMIDTLPAAQQAAIRTTFNASLGQLVSPWMRYFLTYDPRPTLRRVKVPVLAMNGTLDLQVPYREDLSAIRQALEAGGNKDYRIVELAGLNHLFQTAKTGSPTEYEKIEETVSPAALELIAGWIGEHVK